MTDNLPRLSKKNTTGALRVLAVIKLIKDELAKADVLARAYLTEKAMSPGDRLTITDTSGASVGTASLSKPRKRGGWTITDPAALAAWCEARGIHHGGQRVLVFPDWFVGQANLEALVHQAGAEIPDGLEDMTEEGRPALSVRMTDEQRRQLISNFQTPIALLEATHAFDREAEQ